MTSEPGLGGNPTHRGGQRAVFLSYASENAQAAQRICGALRAAGIEVWFDQSELRGGDAWDSAIRKQIRSRALFIPVISTNTHARVEGYFRLEWKLAVDRSHLLAPDQACVVPVAIDQTPQSDERLPDRFRELQWTHRHNRHRQKPTHRQPGLADNAKHGKSLFAVARVPASDSLLVRRAERAP